MNWRNLNENLGSIGDVLRQQVAKKQMWEDAQRKGQMDLDFAIKKAQAEAAMDPEKQFFSSVLNQGTSQLSMPSQGGAPIVPVQTGGMPDKSMLIRGLIAKKFGVPFENLMTPEERQIAEEGKPLAGDTAAKYSGATQGIKSMNEIVKMIGLKNINGKITANSNAKDLIKQANLAIEASTLQNQPPSFYGAALPFMRKAEEASKLSRVGSEGSQLANLFNTLAENLLRARTGATAPNPEIVREMSRSLFRVWQEDPSAWRTKLMNNLTYLEGVAKEIRPRSYQQDIGQLVDIFSNRELVKTSITREQAIAELKRRGK